VKWGKNVIFGEKKNKNFANAGFFYLLFFFKKEKK
jgi:hypothetical protein